MVLYINEPYTAQFVFPKMPVRTNICEGHKLSCEAAAGCGLGTAEAPLKNVAEAVTAADNGFTIILAPGSYDAAGNSPVIISKALTLVNGNPAGGAVVIGVSE